VTEKTSAGRDPGALLRASWERGRLAQALLLHGPSLPALEREAEGLAALIVEAFPTLTSCGSGP
jgi:hypothetical protein